MFSAELSQSDRKLAQEAGLESLFRGALDDLDLGAASLNCCLATPAEVRRLNREFAGSDHVTDVLAFPGALSQGDVFLPPPGVEHFLGDIVISVRTAARQAYRAGNQAQSELRLLAAHGLLHLLGHDHGDPGQADRMTRATQLLLGQDARRRGVKAPSVPDLQPPA